MTHDELLARIEKRHWHLFNFHSEDQSDKAIDFRMAVQNSTRALRAGVEIETYSEQGFPESTMDNEMELRDHTLLEVRKAIEKELS